MGFLDHLIRDVRSIINRDGEENAIPPLDGALSPNDRLDACTLVGDALPGLDDVIATNDGAVFVSNADKNPTLTIMALAWRTSDHILARMRRKEL